MLRTADRLFWNRQRGCRFPKALCFISLKTRNQTSSRTPKFPFAPSSPHYPKLTLLTARLRFRHFLPLWLKIPSISILLREWAMQRDPQGTKPSAAGDRSVVRTRHQSGLSWGLSRTSTVCPRRIVSSLLLQAVKSWITTVSSHPPDNCEGEKQEARWMLVIKPSVTHRYLFRIPGRMRILDETASFWDFPCQEEIISKGGSSGVLEQISNSACLCLCSKHTGCDSAGRRI